MAAISRLIAIVAVPFLLGVASAEPPPPGQGPRPDRPEHKDKEHLRGQIFDQWRSFRMWKMTEELKLDEASAAKLFPLLSKFDEQERDLGRERGHTYRELRGLIDQPHPDGARIDVLVERIAVLRAKRNTLEQDKVAAIRKVLTPIQMGRLVMLMPRLEEGFRQKIRDALEGSRGEPGRPEGRHRFRPDMPIVP